MKITALIAVIIAAIIFGAVGFKIGYQEYLSRERAERIAVAMQQNTYVPQLHSTAPPTMPPTTQVPKPAEVLPPEEFIVFTAENTTGTPVGSTTDSPNLENSIFVGDSVSLGFARYCAQKGIMKNTTFLTAGSYAVHYALSTDVSENKGFNHPMYKGKETPLRQAVAEIRPDNIYFCLGINDISGFGVEGTVKNYCKLINAVREINPDIHVYIVSTTFMVDDAQKTNLNNLNLANLNHNMKAICEKYDNLDYIDIMSALQSEKYALSGSYCSDGFIHQSKSAYVIWAEKLGAE